MDLYSRSANTTLRLAYGLVDTYLIINLYTLYIILFTL